MMAVIVPFVAIFLLLISPAAAGTSLKDLAKGVGAIIILNELGKGQASENGASGGQTSTNQSQVTQQARSGNRAAQSQEYLNDLGYDAGPVDGRPGRRTRSAIEDFQRDRGFAVTGELTSVQFAALRSNRQTVVSPSAPGAISSASAYEAQVYLNQLGFNTGSPDGAWGPRSQQALDSYRLSADHEGRQGTLNQDDISQLHLQVHGVPVTIAGGAFTQTTAANDSRIDGFGTSVEMFGDPSSMNSPSENANALDSSAYRHFGAPVEGSQGLRRDIAIQMLKSRPNLLDVDDNIENWFRWEHPHIAPTELRTKFRNANSLEQKEIMRQFKADLLQEADDTPAVSEENPLKVAIYNGVKYGFGDYVDGIGLPFASGSAAGASFKNELGSPYLRQRLVVHAETPGAEYADLTRQQASAMLDNIKDSKKTLYRVAWGRFTNIGQDKSVASFADADGVFNEVQIASTFEVDRLTLSLGSYSGVGQWEPTAPEVIHDYPTGTPTELYADGQSAFEYLQSSGLPIKNEHILTFPQQLGQRVIAEVKPEGYRVDLDYVKGLFFRAWLLQNPDYASEGRNFILVAHKILDASEKRQFFGDSVRFLGILDGADGTQDVARELVFSGGKLFPDEFAEADAKEAFLSDFLPRKLAEISDWNVPVMQVFGATLVRYDAEGGFFPIIYDDDSVSRRGPDRVAGIAAIGKYNQVSHLYSADRVGTRPDKLTMPRDQARELRSKMNGSDRIYLAWTANLNMEEDGLAFERAMDPKTKIRGFTQIVRRASIGRIGLFIDPELKTMVKEIDASSLEILPKDAASGEKFVDENISENRVAIKAAEISVNKTAVAPNVELAAMPSVTVTQDSVSIQKGQQSAWPQIGQLVGMTSDRDMVGLRIGSPLSGADRIVEKAFDVTQTYHTDVPLGKVMAAYDYIRVFVIDGGKQVISVMSYSPDGPILGISRHLYKDGEPWPDAVIAKSLVDKYGEPTTRTFADRNMIWAGSDACTNLTLSPVGARQFVSVGSGMQNGELDEYLAAQALGGLAVLAKSAEAVVDGNANCGEIFWYSNQPLAPVSGHNGFFTFMTNWGLAQQVLEAAKPNQEKLEIKF